MCWIRYHGDFDWSGLTIANGVMARFGARSWRYGTEDYEAAVAAGAGAGLEGRPTTATWANRLSPAMRRAGRKVEEEHVIADLLTDLSHDGRRL